MRVAWCEQVALALAMPLMSGPQRRGQQAATYGAIARGAAVYTASALAGLVAPLLFAVARVVLLGGHLNTSAPAMFSTCICNRLQPLCTASWAERRQQVLEAL